MAETVEITIEGLGARGDGIARWRGETLFVPFTAPGDVIKARLGTRREGGREAHLTELVAPGPGRAQPICRHFGHCGGCAMQHLDAAAYRGVKLAALSEALRRAGIDPAVVAPLKAVPAARRRAGLGLRPPATVGFRERFRHAVVELRECPVLDPALFALVEPLRGLARFGPLEASLTVTDSGVDLLFETRRPAGLDVLEALAAFAERHDLARVMWGRTPVVERRRPRVVLSGVAVPFPPGAFLQASAAAEAVLVGEVLAAAADERPVLDLYAGLGTFALALPGRVHAVEGNAEAVAALASAGAPGVTVERRDLERDPLPPEQLTGYRAAIFDPPRAGARRQAAALAASSIPTVVAVSCNPATFARDAALLIAGGYRLERVAPIDQFVWTPHLELAAVFRR